MDSENVPDSEAAKVQVDSAPVITALRPHDNEQDREERAGLILAMLIAIALPALVLLAIFLPNSGALSLGADGDTTGTGLDRVDIAEQSGNDDVVQTTGINTEVAGATEEVGDESDPDVDTETGSAETLEADEGRVEVLTPELSANDATNASTSAEDDGVSNNANASDTNGASTAQTPSAATSSDNADASANNSSDSRTNAGASRTTDDDDNTEDGGPTASRNDNNATTSPTVDDNDDDRANDDNDRQPTATPTTTTRPPATPTTQTTAAVAPASTAPTTTTTTTTTEAPRVEPVEFAQRIDIGAIGETSLRFRFSSAADSVYVVTIRSNGSTIKTQSGNAQAGVLVNETVTGLTAGTDYTVQVTLSGPPAATSPTVPFRTPGGQPPAPVVTPVTIGGVETVEVGATRFQVNYTSNICANGSFTIREQGGGVVGSNAGQAAGCTTRHLAVPGFWTPALKPNTTYVITLTVEANGQGQGAGNTASRSVTVTTSS